jgi:uncharacterized protein (TIGR02145 family)
MLSPRLTNCPECANIPSLLKKIDCKLAELGNNLYNNISYMLNKPVPSSDILQLIGYRRILMYKYCNPNYVHKYSVQMIASRVIRLTAGCVSKCNELERCLEEPCDIKIVPNPTTTSTSTLPITTTTTSTTAVPTTTTTSSSSTSTTTSTSSSSTSTTTSTSSSTTSTTSTTTGIPFCVPECFPLFSKGTGVFIYKNFSITDLTSQITGPIPVTGDVANTSNKLWLYGQTDMSEYDINGFCPFSATYNKNIKLASGLFGSGMTAIDDITLVTSIGTNIVEVDVATATAGITVKFPMPTNRDISGDLIYTTSNQLVCSYVDNITSNTYITIHDYSTGAILVDINISSIIYPWGLYIDAGVIQVCDNNGQIFSLDLDTEVLTLVANVGQSLNGASQAPECAILNPITTTTTTTIEPTTTTTTTIAGCTSYDFFSVVGDTHSIEYIPCGLTSSTTLNIEPGGGGVNACIASIISDNYPDATNNVGPCSEPTTTTTSSSSTTTTTTTVQCISYSWDLSDVPPSTEITLNYIDCYGNNRSNTLTAVEFGQPFFSFCATIDTPNTPDITGGFTNNSTCGCNPNFATTNLDVTTYRNGDPIPEVTDPTQWANLTTGAWCYYDNDPANGAIYGKLYNWFAVNDPRGLAPVGYHVASNSEWTCLVSQWGGQPIAGGRLKETGTTHWLSPNAGATNVSGFAALPTGVRFINGSYLGIGAFTYIWTSDSFTVGNGRSYEIVSSNTTATAAEYQKVAGLPVRLIIE